MKNEELLIDIVNKYHLSNPVCEKDQEYIRKQQKRMLLCTLRKEHQRFSILGIAITIIYFCKKCGLTLSLIKVYFCLSIISVTIIGFVGYGSYSFIKNLNKEPVPVSKKSYKHESLSKMAAPQGSIKKTANKIVIVPIKHIIAVQKFSINNVDVNFRDHVYKELCSALIKLRGVQKIITFDQVTNDKKAGLALIGSIDYFEDIYAMNVKIVDLEKMSSIFITSVEFKSRDELQKICYKLASRITDEINKNY